MLCPRCLGSAFRATPDGRYECVAPVVGGRERSSTGAVRHAIPAVGICGELFTVEEGARAAGLVEAVHRAEDEVETAQERGGRIAAELRSVADPTERLLRTVGAYVALERRRVAHPWGAATRLVAAHGTDWEKIDRVLPRAFDHVGEDTVLHVEGLDDEVARWFAANAGRFGTAADDVAWPVPRRTVFGRPAVVCRIYIDERPGPPVPGWAFQDGSTERAFGSDNSLALVSARGALHLGPERIVESRGGRGTTTARVGRLNVVALVEMAARLGFPEAAT